MKDEEVAGHVRAVLERRVALVHKHGFNPSEHGAYIDTILERFRNPALTDEVSRRPLPDPEAVPGRPPGVASHAGFRKRACLQELGEIHGSSDVRCTGRSGECGAQASVRDIGASDTASNIPALPVSIRSWVS